MNVNFLENEEFTSGQLYQWDLNQELVISGLNFTTAPSVHFCNKKSEQSLLVDSTLENGKIICDVPNVLLKEAFPIIAYITQINDNQETTLHRIDITVRQRVKPSDYIFNDNVPIKTFETVEAYIKACFDAQMEELDDRMDEISEELQDQVDAYINREDVTEYATASVFAQLPLIEGYSATVFGSAVINGTKYGIGLYNTSDDANQYIVIYNIDTGAKVTAKQYTKLGHANDVTYDATKGRLLIASMPAAGSAAECELAIVPWTGGTLGDASTVTLEGRAFAVHVSGSEIFVLFSNDLVRVYDLDFKLKRSMTLATKHHTNVTYQSMFVDDNYIYRTCGIRVRGWNQTKAEPFEAVDTYHKSTGEFYKRTLLPIQYEVESITRIDDDFYVCVASVNIGIIYKANIIHTDKTYGLLPGRTVYPGIMESAGLVMTHYIDEAYAGFFMDGSADHPFTRFWHGFESVPDYINDTRIILNSDLTTNIQIKRSSSKISINGNYHKVPGIYIEDIQYIKISNMTITERNTTTNVLLASTHTKTVDLSGITFDGEANNTVYMYGGDLHIENCTFAKKALSTDLNMLSGVSLVLRNNTYNVDLTLSNQGISYLVINTSDIDKFIYSCTEFNSNAVSIDGSTNVPLIKLGGKYLITGGTHPIGMPAGINFRVLYVRPVSSANVILEATASNGDFYMAHSVDGVIKKWINVRNPEDVIEINEAELDADMQEVYG